MLYIFSPRRSWYPPGHGDFYDSFRNSGLLDEFIAEGREFCFISNIDNLGATVDLNIMNSLFNPKTERPPEFLMELTNKTRADVKVCNIWNKRTTCLVSKSNRHSMLSLLAFLTKRDSYWVILSYLSFYPLMVCLPSARLT
jgi:UDP-N-acetylglucosamine pyrophosphorylase